MSRFTEEDHSTINQFSRLFGESIFKYFFVVFTRKDELERNHLDIQDFIKNSPPQMMSFIQKCGGRVFTFDNTVQGAKQSIQVEELLSEVQENLKINGGKYYRNEMYEEAERQILIMEEEKKRKEKEEMRRKELKKIKDKSTIVYHKEFERENNYMTDLHLELEKQFQKQGFQTSEITTEYDRYEREFHESLGMDVLHQDQVLVSRDEELMAKQNEEVERDDQEFITKKDEKFRNEVRKQIDETPLMSLRYINAINGFF